LPLNVFGAFAKVYIVRDILLPFLSFSLGMSVIYNPTENRKALVATSSFLSIIQVLVIYIGGFIVSYILLLTKYFEYNDFILILILIGISGLNVFYMIFFSLFEREEKFVFNSILNIIVAVFSSAIVILTSFFVKDILPLLLKELIPIFLLLVIYTIIILRDYGIKSFVKENIDRRIIKGMVNYSLKMYLSRSAEAFFFKLDMLIVSRLFPKETVGLYERARYFASLGWATISNYVNRIHFVKYIKATDLQLFKKTNYYSVGLNLILFLATLGIIYLLDKNTEKEVWYLIFMLMPFFGGYAIGSIVENFKTYFYAKGEVIYAMIALRILPIIFFTALIVLIYFISNFSVQSIALISSLTYVTSIFFIKLFPKISNLLRAK